MTSCCVMMTFLCSLQRLAEEWQRVFFIAAGVYLLGALGFALLASGDVQPWAKDQGDDDKESGYPKHEMKLLHDSKEAVA